MSSALSLAAVTKEYPGEVFALREVEVEVADGEQVAVLGTPGQTFLGANEILPDTAVPMIGDMTNVGSAAAVYQVPSANVYRNRSCPPPRPEGSASTPPATICPG